MIHEHRFESQTLRHTHPHDDVAHGYFEHPEDGIDLSTREPAPECMVCGDPEIEDHAHEAVVMRDGNRGQYLSPQFVFDVAGLVGSEKIPTEITALAQRWLDGELVWEPDETQIVFDWVTYQGPSLLADAGYSDVWDDGYVIFRRELTRT